MFDTEIDSAYAAPSVEELGPLTSGMSIRVRWLWVGMSVRLRGVHIGNDPVIFSRVRGRAVYPSN